MKKNHELTGSSIRPLSLLSESVSSFRKDMNLFLKITMVVTIPVAFLLGTQDGTFGNDYAVFSSLASVFLFLALIWTYFNKNKAKKLKISEIYKKVSASFLQAIMATILTTLISVPLLVILVATILLFSAIPQYWYYYIIPIVLLAFVSSLLITKYSLGYVIIIKEEDSSFRAISRSGKLLKNNVLKFFFGYFLFFAIVIFINLLIVYLLSLSQSLSQNSLLLMIINSILISLYLPILIIYMCKSYEKLILAKE